MKHHLLGLLLMLTFNAQALPQVRPMMVQKWANNLMVSEKKTTLYGTVINRGGFFCLVSDGHLYTLGLDYKFDLESQAKLDRFARHRIKVAVEGTLQRWGDGSAGFNRKRPLTITPSY